MKKFFALFLVTVLLSGCGLSCPEQCEQDQQEILKVQQELDEYEQRDVIPMILEVDCKPYTAAEKAADETGAIKSYGLINYACDEPAQEQALRKVFGDLANERARLQMRRDELYQKVQENCPCAENQEGEVYLRKCTLCEGKIQGDRCPFKYLPQDECAEKGGEIS